MGTIISFFVFINLLTFIFLVYFYYLDNELNFFDDSLEDCKSELRKNKIENAKHREKISVMKDFSRYFEDEFKDKGEKFENDNFRSSIIREEFESLSRAFYDSQVNPEVLLTKPLLLDVSVYNTKNMIDSFNRVRVEMESFTGEESSDRLDQLDFLLGKAKNDFMKADEYATRIGIPGIESDKKRRARKSFNIVIDDSSTKEEKITHWNNVLKIIRDSGVKENAINNVNSLTIGAIHNGKIGQLLELQ